MTGLQEKLLASVLLLILFLESTAENQGNNSNGATTTTFFTADPVPPRSEESPPHETTSDQRVHLASWPQASQTAERETVHTGGNDHVRPFQSMTKKGQQRKKAHEFSNTENATFRNVPVLGPAAERHSNSTSRAGRANSPSSNCKISTAPATSDRNSGRKEPHVVGGSSSGATVRVG